MFRDFLPCSFLSKPLRKDQHPWSAGTTYRVIPNKYSQIFDRLELICLEDCWLSGRVRHKILDGYLANLRVGMGDEAHELKNVMSFSCAECMF